MDSDVLPIPSEPEITFAILELLEYARVFGLFDQPGGMAALNDWMTSSIH
jgi:hypothetical protein